MIQILLGLCFFVSGATSLVLQVAWTKELGYVLGNTLYAMATVVAAFMGGLGFGSFLSSVLAPRVARPILAYAIVQALIAALGAVSIVVLRATEPLFASLYTSLGSGLESGSGSGSGAFLAARFAVVVALMLVPVTLMGMTLPLVVGALARAKRSYAFEAGLAYGVNTLGAVAGTWAAGFLLVPRLGLSRTVLVAAAADLAVAGVAFGLSRRAGAMAATPRARAGGWTAAQWWIGSAFLASGAVAMVLEVAWFRLLGLAMGPTVYVFSAMLGTFLLGVGAGSAAFAGWARGTRLGGVGAFAALEALLGIGVLGSLWLLNELPRWNAIFYLRTSELLDERAFAISHVLLAAVVVLPPCLVMGALFPTAVRAIRESGHDGAPEANVGRLYLLNTLGGIAGSLVAGFVLLPAFGLTRTLAGSGIASVAIGAALWIRGGAGRSKGRGMTAVATAAGAAALALAALAPKLDVSLFNLGLYREVYARSSYEEHRLSQSLLYYSEGVNAPVSVFNTGASTASLRVSGKTDASTGVDDVRTQLLLGHLSALFAREPRDAAVIGYGCGATVRAVLAHPTIRSVDVLEIERGVIGASPFFECVNGSPLADPRTRLIVEDGRAHVTYTRRDYDVIVSEPSNPWMAGVGNLFTTEFYRAARSRLRDGGVFGQWIQTYEISRETFRTVLATVTEVFPEFQVFSTGPGDLLVVGSAQPIRIPFETLAERFASDRVRASMETVELDDPRQLAFFSWGSPEAVRRFIGGIETRNTDDNAWLEYRMPVDLMTVARRALERADSSGGDSGEPEIPPRLEDERVLRAFAAIVPGLPLAETAHAVTATLYAPEPVFGFGDDLVHPLWPPLEERQVASLRAEASATDDEELAAAIRVALERDRAAFDRRIEIARALEITLASGKPPDRARLSGWTRAAPGLSWAHVVAGRLELEAGRPAEARRSFERVIDRRMSAHRGEAIRGAAEAALALGATDEALALLAEGVASNPYDRDTVLAYATVLERTGSLDALRGILADAVRHHPNDPGVLAAAGRAGVPLAP